MDRQAERMLAAARSIRSDSANLMLPPADGPLPSPGERVLTMSLVRGTRGYIERVAKEVNCCYEQGCYDACAVMIRRLVETLIIETFEHHSLEAKIRDSNGDYLMLGGLVDAVMAETSWNLGRSVRTALPKLKRAGDLSAHNRRYNAHRTDIDERVADLRVVVQELLYLAGFP